MLLASRQAKAGYMLIMCGFNTGHRAQGKAQVAPGITLIASRWVGGLIRSNLLAFAAFEYTTRMRTRTRWSDKQALQSVELLLLLLLTTTTTATCITITTSTTATRIICYLCVVSSIYEWMILSPILYISNGVVRDLQRLTDVKKFSSSLANRRVPTTQLVSSTNDLSPSGASNVDRLKCGG